MFALKKTFIRIKYKRFVVCLGLTLGSDALFDEGGGLFDDLALFDRDVGVMILNIF